MNRRRRRPNIFGWAVFGLVVLFGYYFNQVYLPSTPLMAEATATPTRSPEAYVTEAEALFLDGKLTQAIETYKAAINASPQNPAYYTALARAQVWAGDYEAAQINAENALLLSPNNAMALAVHAWALNFQAGRNGDALKDIEAALTIDPNNALINSYYVEILTDSGFDNLEQAAIRSRLVLELDPNIVETHRARGYLLARAPDPIPNPDPITNLEEAVQEYNTAIQINPNLALLHLEQGNHYRFLYLIDEAVRSYTIANTLNPADPQPDYLISRAYSTVGEYGKARQYAESAVIDSPGDAFMHGNLGVMLYRNAIYEAAVQQLGLAVFGGMTEDGAEVTGIPLSNSLRVGEIYFHFGLALARTDQCGQALQIVQQLQSGGPSDDTTLDAMNRIIELCQENLENPAKTPVPTDTN